MSLYLALLDLAEELSTVRPGQDTQIESARLRRSISTAYYALFHFLVEASVSSLTAVPEAREYLRRSFDHKDIRNTCASFDGNLSKALRKICRGDVPRSLGELAKLFVELQEHREYADYSLTYTPTQADARSLVGRVRDAVSKWPELESEPIVRVLLAALLLKRQFDKHTERGD